MSISYYVVLALATMAAAPFAGTAADRYSGGRVAPVGAALQGAGFALLAFVVSPAQALVAAAMVGAGGAVFRSGFVPVVASLVEQRQRSAAFSARYVAMNVGLGVGSVVGGVVIARYGLAGFRVLYVVDAASFLPLAVAVRVRGPRHAGPDRPETASAVNAFRLLRLRAVRRLLAVQVLLAMFGFAQLESALPLVLHEEAGLRVSVVGVLILVNTTSVVLVQVPITRAASRTTEPVSLMVCGATWVVAYLVGLVMTSLAGAWLTVLVLLFPALFAAGEALYSSAFQPLVTRLSPTRSLGRTTGVMELGWNVGVMAGPAVGIGVARAGHLPVYWLAMAGMAAVAAALGRTLRQYATGFDGDSG